MSKNPESAERRDIATEFNEPYSLTAPRVLGDIHAELLKALELRNEHEQQVLMVFGPGGRVLPYSRQYIDGALGESNRDWLVKAIGKNGKMVCVDYVTGKEEGGLELERETLQDLEFFEPGYFQKGAIHTSGTVDSTVLPPGSISFVKNNLREPLRFKSELATKIDATLSLHHASLTRAELARLYAELFRTLKPGGLLHLGEGNVDMNYSEDKLIQVGMDIATITNNAVRLHDDREIGSGQSWVYHFQPGETYPALPIFTRPGEVQPDNPMAEKVVVTGEGEIQWHVRDFTTAMVQLEARGYKTFEVASDPRGSGILIQLPLIDPFMRKDQARHILPVDAFYDAIMAKVNRYKGTRDDLVEKITIGAERERSFALKGIVEYYMGEETITKTLTAVGFSDIKVVHHEAEPFYNITARRPANS